MRDKGIFNSKKEEKLKIREEENENK